MVTSGGSETAEIDGAAGEHPPYDVHSSYPFLHRWLR